ncbi:protein of unknown function [Burkholderia multivorans]
MIGAAEMMIAEDMLRVPSLEPRAARLPAHRATHASGGLTNANPVASRPV